MTQEHPSEALISVIKELRERNQGRVPTQAEIRKHLGLPPARFTPASYRIEGLTDVQVFKKQAEKKQAAGQASWIHYHRRGMICKPECTYYKVTQGR